MRGVFLCFGGQKKFKIFFFKYFSNRIEKLHKMAFIIFFLVKKFEKVEKTGFFRAKSFFHCTLSLILGMQTKQAKMVSISTYEMTGGRRIL